MTDLEIRSQLAKYLGCESTKQQFQEWFTKATWEVDQSPDEKLKQLAYTIELAFAEHLSGHLSEAELKAELAPLARKFTMRLSTGSSNTSIVMGSSSTTESISAPVTHVGRSRAVVLS